MPTDAQIAQQLVSIKQKPEGLSTVAVEAERAWAYHKRKPYPMYGFRTWKTEDLGPLPMCLPTARKCVKRGARFLFGKGFEIKCAGNEPLETFLRDAWADNQMPARAVAMAERGAIEGGIVLKFAYDPEADPKLSIQTLSLVSQVRLFHHPHNRQKVLMARVQYPYMDAEQKARCWYREEWTAEEMVVYKPIKCEAITNLRGSDGDPDTHDGWEIETRTSNPFGLIPLTHIKNLETDDVFGTGDLWELWEILDALALVYYQMRRSNQFDAELNPWIIDGEMDDDAPDGPVRPGETIRIKTENEGDATQQAKVVFPSGGNGLRDSMMEYAKALLKMFEEAAGTSTVDAAEVTNKGNLTIAVLMQLYQISLELLAEKQKSYGQNGIELFLEAVAKGLAKHKAESLGVSADPKTWNVEIAWPAPFEMGNDEKTAAVAGVQAAESAGYTTHDRAVEAVAQIHGVRDIKKLKEELAKEPRPEPVDPNLPNPTGKQNPNGRTAPRTK